MQGRKLGLVKANDHLPDTYYLQLQGSGSIQQTLTHSHTTAKFHAKLANSTGIICTNTNH